MIVIMVDVMLVSASLEPSAQATSRAGSSGYQGGNAADTVSSRRLAGGFMGGVYRWTGREVLALRRAQRQTKRGFAEKLGVTHRTVANWELERVTMTPFSQGLLDQTLADSTPDIRQRFEDYLADRSDRDLQLDRSSPQQDTDGAISEIPSPMVLLVPPEEPDMVHRADVDDVVALLAEAVTAQPATSVAVWGPGGFGKSTLSTQVSHDRRVRQLFTEILWVETGEHCTPARVVQLIGDLCVHLGEARPALANPEQAGFHLARVLGERRALIVIDNVWSAADLSPLLFGGPNCVRLITTRNLRVCPARTSAYRLGPMSPPQIRELLSRAVAGLDSAHASYLADLCGGWPLLASIVGANVGQEIAAGAAQDEAVLEASNTLRIGGPHALDVWDSLQRRAAIGQALSSSLASLDDNLTVPGAPRLRERYLSLAIFPAATAVPLSVVATWWAGAYGWHRSTVRQFCRLLTDRSLLSAYRADQDVIVLHDVFRAYLRHLIDADWTSLHQSLLDAYRPAGGDWAALDPGQTYLWRHLPYHLREAGMLTELVDLLARPDYLITKALLCGPDALVADQAVLHSCLTRLTGESDTARAAVTSALALTGAGFLLGGLTRRQDIAATLLVRLLHTAADSPAAQQLRRLADDPNDFIIGWVCREPAAASEHSGHVGAVTAVAVHEATIVSGGEDSSVRTWHPDPTRRRVYAGHTGWVFAVAISPDGLLVASAGDDAVIRLWDTRTDMTTGFLVGHTRRIRSLAFARTGRLLVSGGEDGQIRVWDVDRLGLIRSMQTPGCPVWSVAISDDKSMIAAAGEDEYLRLYDLDTGQLTDEVAAHRDWIRAVAFAAEAPVLASGSGDGGAKLWNVADRRLSPMRQIPRQPTRLRAVTVSPGGDLLVTAGEDATLRAYSAGTTIDNRPSLPEVDWIRALARTTAGTIVAGCEDGSLRTWDHTTQDPPTVLAPGSNTIWSAAFAQQGQLSLLGKGDGLIEVRDSAAQTDRTIVAGAGRVWSLAAGGDFLAAACGDGTVRVWSLTDDRWSLHLDPQQGRTWAVAVNRTGTLLAAGTRGNLHLWDLPSGRLLWTRATHHGERIRSLAFSDAGNHLLSGGGDGTAQLWDADINRQITEFSNPGTWVRAVAVDATGERAAIGYGSGTIHIHTLTNEAKPHVTLAGHTGRPLMLGFARQADQLVSAAADGTIRAWSLIRQRQDAEVRIAASLQCAAYTADTDRILSASASGATMVTVGDPTEKG
ncbi:NB-ARC domain-containing protein [Actinoplanes sp. NPDC051859]|uniref:NB-ARC domain-containing protein n=1 Tax=Actinoplanes sp. NPDC051859 TaxID=3363909 RepID=UPI00378B81D5